MARDQRARRSARRERMDALADGAMIALGVTAVVDNVMVHWLLELHRAGPGEHALRIELALLALGIVLIAVGTWREARAWRALPTKGRD